jgi:hypothetical protein
MALFDFLARAARGAVTRDPRLAGTVISSLDNYIPSHYKANDPVTRAVLDTTHEAPKMFSGVLDTILPESRALKATHNITPTQQQTVQTRINELQRLESGTPEEQAAVVKQYAGLNPVAKIVAKMRGVDIPEENFTPNRLRSIMQGNVEYADIAAVQTGGKRAPPSEQVVERTFLQGQKPYSPENYRAALSEQNKRIKGKDNRATEEELDAFANHAGQVWESGKGTPFSQATNATFGLRHPHGGPGASTHWQGFYKNNELLNPIAEAFGELKNTLKRGVFENTSQMKQFLENKTVKKKNSSGSVEEVPLLSLLKGEDETGLYFSTSYLSPVKTDGGVNLLFKVKKDGKGLFLVSDEHNFVEKWPIIGPYLEKALGRSLNTTPIVPFDLKQLKQMQTGGTERASVKMDLPVGGEFASWDQGFKTFVDAVPDSEELKLQRAIAGIRGAGVAGAGYGLFGGDD